MDRERHSVSPSSHAILPLGAHFTGFCASAIAQLQFSVEFGDSDRDRRARIVVRSCHGPEFCEAEKLFPPLLFLPVSNRAFLNMGVSINRNHPTAKWLLEDRPADVPETPGISQQSNPR